MDDSPYQQQSSLQPRHDKPLKVMKIKKKKVKAKKDFQDEFMDKYDEFSQSWRDQIDRQRRF